MPKKFHKPAFSKPASSAHPALATSSSPATNGGHQPDTTLTSVNELIGHLRRSQATSKSSRDDFVPTPTVHPSLKGLLQVADTPPPRPRPGVRHAGSRTIRRTPGPPPPRSWLDSSIHAPKHLRYRVRVASQECAAPDRLDRLPGADLPISSSLLHQSLKAISCNWEWHISYDQYYLAAMPVRLKAILLAYIAFYGHGKSLDIDGLNVLFLDELELDGATGCEEITHLDLSGSLNHRISFKQLDKYFSKAGTGLENLLDEEISSQAPHTPTPDSWETPAVTMSSIIPTQLLQTSTFRFPNLTHLSLSHPNTPNLSWSRFLAFAGSHLATLTHLSLAHWPTPSLTPNANANSVTTSSKHAPHSSVSYGGGGFYSADEGDWSEAAGVLMRLSRATYCLKWLDLEGCGAWVKALQWEGESGGGVEWCGGWRAVETVKVLAGWIPENLQSLRDEKKREEARKGPGDWVVEDERRKYYAWQDVLAWDRVHVDAKAVESWVRSKRRAVGGLRITFEIDAEAERFYAKS